MIRNELPYSNISRSQKFSRALVTSDFRLVLESIQKQLLEVGFSEQNSCYQYFCRERIVANFKKTTLFSVDFDPLEKVEGSIEHGALAPSRF